MRFRRSLVRVAVASLVLSLPSLLWAGYSWSGVSPEDGADDVDTTPLDFEATVSWTATDHALWNGTVKANVTPANGGPYTGTISWSYGYTTSTDEDGGGSGRFGNFSGGGGDGQVFFSSPWLSTGDSVKMTFTAYSTVPSGPGQETTYKDTKTTTITSE